MDPCPFVRVLVGDLALKMPAAAAPSPSARGAGTHVHPTTAHCYCRIRLDGVPYQTAAAPLLPPTEDGPASCTGGGLAAAFHLSKPDLDRAAGADRGGSLLRAFRPRRAGPRLKVAVYVARAGGGGGGAEKRGRLLGKVALRLDLGGSGALARPVVFHAGWVPIAAKGRGGGSKSSKGELHLTVRADPDPRFVFQFEGEPERSPLVMQVRGGMRQPMFTCRFSSSCRGGRDDLRSRSAHSDPGGGFGGSFPAPAPDLRRSRTGSWLARLGSARDAGTRRDECRKGWSVTVHDLSGSPVALASMVTPFAASPGTDRVGRSSPGAWLLLRPRPADGAWTPWGRLECWRDGRHLLAYRFHLLLAGAGAPRVVAESAVSAARGGRFAIDLTSAAEPPVDLGGDFFGAGGFVMAADVQGEGRPSRPTVEVGVAHVGCAEDAAAFVALAAAVDLSMDACRLFSCRLRRELLSSSAAA